MKTMTIWRAYRKAYVQAMWGKMRTKKQRARNNRHRRQRILFETKLVERMLEDDQRAGR